jgi:hypothetical protein
VEVGWDEVRARRLARSSLEERASDAQLVEVVSAVCGMHAQVQAAAELQLAARVDGIEQADVRAALWEQRSLVKAWTIRGTLHLHPAEELSLRRGAARRRRRGGPRAARPAGSRGHGSRGSRRRRGRGCPRRSWAALDGRCLLRDELAEEVVKLWAPRKRLRSGFAVFLDALRQGPPQGSRITLVRPDEGIDGWQRIDDEEEALREVCRCFLRGYGPARPADFSEWFSSTAFKLAETRSLFDELAGELEEITVDDRRCFTLAGDQSFPKRPAGQVWLLPEHDVYVMGSRERDQLVPPPVSELIAGHGGGRYEGAAGARPSRRRRDRGRARRAPDARQTDRATG